VVLVRDQQEIIEKSQRLPFGGLRIRNDASWITEHVLTVHAVNELNEAMGVSGWGLPSTPEPG
jgi:hypothetical protein